MVKEDNKSNIINNNFILRSITTLIAVPIVIYNVYLGSFFFKAMILILAILMAFEWNQITKNPDATLKQNMMWKLIGVFYILLPCLSLIWMREQEKGNIVIFWLLANVWVTDIAAYVVGKVVGGWKIWPNISPNKTWSGFIAGVLAAALVGYVTARLNNSEKSWLLILISIVLSIYGQIGDMIESWIKRHFNVKDSGKMIPGHGGILDRVDSLVPVAPKVVVLLLFEGNIF